MERPAIETKDSAPAGKILHAQVDCLWAAGAVLGEGLTYDARTKTIWFVDIKTQQLFSYGLDDCARRRWALSEQVSSLAVPTEIWRRPYDADHHLLCVGRHGFGWLGIRGQDTLILPISHPEAALVGNRFNDGKLGPDGRFYAGTMDDSEERATGAMYSFDANGEVTRMDDGFLVTNGPAFSNDGRTIYANDSARRLTYTYRIDSDGCAGDRRIFHAFSERDGYPDGMTVDAGGSLWIAMWDGGKIQRLDSEGRPSGFVPTPVQRPTNVIMLDNSDLIFTSAAIGLAPKSELDGGLFRIRLSSAI